MPDYRDETNYLDKVVTFLNRQTAGLKETLKNYREQVTRARIEQGTLYADLSSAGHSADLNQQLEEDARQVAGVQGISAQLRKYEAVAGCPYFARFDFEEDGLSADKIYIGINSIDDESDYGDILVYDWRAPVCSMFYRNETGPASYEAPGGVINGSITLKRQYKIVNSRLIYYFDSSLAINDDILQDVLGQNASLQMQNVVKTIQREQDMVIRDENSSLVMAQGAAGSGKTTVALHRIAYMLYHGRKTGLSSSNILIISPGEVFSQYISNVLPELGEANVPQISFDTLSGSAVAASCEKKETFLDRAVSNSPSSVLTGTAYIFKTSAGFAEILRRFLAFYEHRLLQLPDVEYGGKILFGGQELKAVFLNNKISAPAASRLRRIQTMVNAKVEEKFNERYNDILAAVKKMDGQEFDYKRTAHRLTVKEKRQVAAFIKKAAAISPVAVYRELFADRERFFRLCKGLDLPENINEIFDCTVKHLRGELLPYDDLAAVYFLHTMTERNTEYGEVRHVVIDEAQDYRPLHYTIFKTMFKNASFTLLGDINQAFMTGPVDGFYDEAAEILNKKNPVTYNFGKTYRSTYEIMNLALRIPEKHPVTVPFERHETAPVFKKCGPTAFAKAIADAVADEFAEGFKTAAVLCKTAGEAERLCAELNQYTPSRVLDENGRLDSGVMVMPVYLAKGLEFDCVHIAGVSAESYDSPMGRSLLYIACTRALHRLTLYYEKEDGLIKMLR